jgi:hypothetical protein
MQELRRIETKIRKIVPTTPALPRQLRTSVLLSYMRALISATDRLSTTARDAAKGRQFGKLYYYPAGSRHYIWNSQAGRALDALGFS